MVDTARSATILPPVLGWNTKDPISEMEESYAVEAINFFSDGGSVDLRKGTTSFAQTDTTDSTKVLTLGEFNAQDGTKHLVAQDNISETYIFSTAGATVNSLIDAGFPVASPTWTVNFRNRIWFPITTAGTSYLATWNGSAFNVALGITGVTVTTLRTPTTYKNRIYFIQASTATMWYLGVDSITGAATSFDFQSLFKLGGKLLFIGTVQQNNLDGQVYFAAISDQGEVLLYQGDYPGSTTWSLVGQFYMPPAIGARSFIYWGANLVIMTYQGIILLSDVLKGDPNIVPLSDKINPSFKEILSVGSNSDYACGVFYPQGNMLVFNIPTSSGASTEQFVMNTVTGSWWRWTGITAFHWCVFNGDLYFGSTKGRVMKAWTGYVDTDPLTNAATNRTCKLRPAYNYFGDRAHLKQFVSAKPIVYQSENLSLTLDANVDFEDVTATNTETTTGDTSYKLYQPTMGLNGMGRCASIRIDGSYSTKRMSLQAIEVIYNQGGYT
jgi:hypothetical protein